MLDKSIYNIKYWFLPSEENKYKPKFLETKFLYFYAVLLLFLKIAVIPFFAYFPGSGFFADVTKTALLELSNESRQSLGFQPLQESLALNQAAQMKAQDMIENDYFAHTSPAGISPWHWFDTIGYNYRFAGENLAIGFIDSGEVNQAWLDSPSHRENLLNQNYNEIGLAVMTGEYQGRETTVVVQLFGSPRYRSVSVQTTEIPQVQPVEEETLPQETAGVAVETETASSFDATQGKPTQVAQTETATETESTVITQTETPKEVLSAFRVTETGKEKSFALSVLSFMSSDYYELLQKILYGSLLFIIILLATTVLFDIFVYNAYEIQYADIFLKTLVFAPFW